MPDGARVLLQVGVCVHQPRRACKGVWNASFAYARAADLTKEVNVSVPADNRTLYAEAVLTHRGVRVAAARVPLTFHARREPTKMLLLDPLRARLWPDDGRVRKRLAAVAAARAREHEPVRRWRPALRLVLGVETAAYPALEAAPPVLRAFVDPRTGTYTPPLLASVLATREDECPEVPAARAGEWPIATVPLRVTVGRTGSAGVMWLAQITAAIEQQKELGFTTKDIDDVKGVLLETPPAVLAVTCAATVLHLAFDLLATKNDIAFWRARRSDLRGISVSTVVFDAVAHVVVLLYLWDNNTSLLVLVPAALAALVDCWKVVRALTLRRRCARASASASASASAKAGTADETAETDRRAYRWLLALLAPVVLGYTSYTLVRVPQRSWGSWLLGSLTSLVHALGFVMMTPQLVVNHRLKTVAHLPWRALVYRALNTFIDDLFAFVIRMPTMHRISCFRDDIVFFIYLYQRWKYPVDKSRCADDDTGGTPAKTKKTQ